MLNYLFQINSDKIYTKNTDPNFRVVRNNYQQQINTILSYYKNRTFSVSTSHLLVQILNHVNAPHRYSVDRYVETVLSRSPYISNSFNFTSELKTGQVFKNKIYGKSNYEIIIYSDEYFNPFDAADKWQDLTPIKLLWYPFSDMNLLIPDNRITFNENGFVVISINIAMLALQHRQWLLQQNYLSKHNPDVIKGPQYFIKRFPIPNVLRQQTDFVLINRLIKIFNNEPIGELSKKYPFRIRHDELKVDDILKHTLDRIDKTNMSFNELLFNIPTFNSYSANNLLRLPDLIPNRQINWSMILSRLPILDFLTNVYTEKKIKTLNRNAINQLRLDFKILRQSNVLKTILPSDLLEYAETTIDKISSKIY